MMLRMAGRLILALLIMGTLLNSTLSALARAPLVDESRGVLTLAPMLETVTPAVVNIAVVLRSDADENPLLKDPFFRKFFGLPETGPLIPQERRARAAGSGVIIDAGKG